MRRTAENRPGAIVHQHEIGDIDRQTPFRIERMAHLEPRIIAFLFRRFDRRGGGATMMALGDEARQPRVVPRNLGRQRMIGGDRQEPGAE